MTVAAGPRGTRVAVEPATGVPLVWLRITVRGGAAGDPTGLEGFHHHMAELTRRGAAGRSRADIDEALDALGASFDVGTGRDAISFDGLCLARNIDALVELAADVIARPDFDRAEHDKLVRETESILDSLRDDDEALASRFFNLSCAPGHPYARAALGTAASLPRLELDQLAAAHARLMVPQNLVIGFAGDIDDTRARHLCDRLIARLPDRAAPALQALPEATHSSGRRLLVVDKPGRVQSQIQIGHPAPTYGADDSRALTVVETAFGGTFTSRLMQEIRVARGWSYGAGCTFGRARGQHWFRIYLAPSAEVTPDAIALTMSMFEQLAEHGITDDELEFAKSYLAGSMPFRRATARQRMRLAVRDEVYGLPTGFREQLPSRLAAVSRADVGRAIDRWLRPGAALTTVVTTAETMAPRLESLGLGELSVGAYDSY